MKLLGVPFGVHYVPLADRGANVLSVFGLARSLGAARFHVLALTSQGRGRALHLPAIDDSFQASVRALWTDPSAALKVVLSSRTRLGAGIAERTARDSWRSAMLDSNGFFYPGEGRRSTRSSRSLVQGVGVAELLSELTSG
jgi:hypothetical protein